MRPCSWWVLGLPLVVVACTPDPALLAIDLVTDYAPGVEVSDFRVQLSDESGAMIAERSVLACVDSGSAACDFLAGARLVELSDLAHGTYRVVTEARRAGTTVARRELLVEIEADRVVTVVMARSCEGVTCGDGLDCVAGVCQQLGCSVENPELCMEDVQCAAASDCPGASPTACEVARCVGGRCLLGGDSSACAAGEWCDPVAGCVPQSTAPECTTAPDADTLALYSFDADVGTNTITDAVGAHPGTITNPEGARFTVGPEGCGSALGFAGPAQTEVPDDPAWDFTEGSVDLFLWHDGAEEMRGVVSRDAVNQDTSGHFTIFLSATGAVHARFQETDASWVRCGPVLSSQTWHHVGVNFGAPAPELWVDGALVEITEGTAGGFGDCTSVPPETGPANANGDNDNPWLIGAHRMYSPEDEPGEGGDPFVGGAIDRLRISAVRRDFTTP